MTRNIQEVLGQGQQLDGGLQTEGGCGDRRRQVQKEGWIARRNPFGRNPKAGPWELRLSLSLDSLIVSRAVPRTFSLAILLSSEWVGPQACRNGLASWHRSQDSML